jgi:hypothetical protein
MSPEQHNRLSQECFEAFDRYSEAAHRMCELLSLAAEHPWSLAYRIEVNECRARENDAHSVYMRARARLLEVAKNGSGVASEV